MNERRDQSLRTPDSPGDDSSGPVAERRRILALDVLRGVALLGILIINVQSFAMTDAAYVNPTAFGDLHGANYWVWYFGHLLADQKFMAVFSMLFGAGILLMTGNREAEGASSAPFHYRRMTVLMIFGILHAYLLWVGDVLYTFAVCGMLLYPCRKLSPRWLLLAGFGFLAGLSVFSLLTGRSMATWPPDRLAAFVRENWQPTAAALSAEADTFHSGWLREVAYRAPIALELETHLFLIRLAWRAGGLMLIGMALYKWGVFTASRSRRFYVAMLACGAILGIPLVAYGVHRNFAAHWDPRYSFFIGSQFNFWGSIVVAFGWIGLVMLACKSPRVLRCCRPLAAVGQMALSNYLLHTIVCSFIFYGIGLGFFGRVSRVGQIEIVLAIWALQLFLSPLWLTYFRFGPAEWLWRSATYLKLQPMLRAPAGADGVGATG